MPDPRHPLTYVESTVGAQVTSPWVLGILRIGGPGHMSRRAGAALNTPVVMIGRTAPAGASEVAAPA